MLEIQNINSYYGESCVLNELSLSVPDGEIVGLIGRNGVGKSTTLKSIMGLIKTTGGSIIFDGNDIIKMPTYERVKKGIGYVPQGRDIFPYMTVQENLEMGLQPLGGKGKIPDYIYELFPIIPEFAIARALAAEPKILILDEPTEGIQPSIIHDIGVAIKKVNEWKHITVLLVEQYLDFVMENTSYLYVMEKGEIIYKNRTADAEKEEVQKMMTS